MKPGEHKTVQARILKYATDIGWTFVSRDEAETRRGIKHLELGIKNEERYRNGSLYFDELLDSKVRKFNPRYAEAEGALLGKFRHLHTDIYGNREFVDHLRNRGKFFDHEEKRELDLGESLADFKTLSRQNGVHDNDKDRQSDPGLDFKLHQSSPKWRPTTDQDANRRAASSQLTTFHHAAM